MHPRFFISDFFPGFSVPVSLADGSGFFMAFFQPPGDWAIGIDTTGKGRYAGSRFKYRTPGII
jgi:hypothetical protein